MEIGKPHQFRWLTGIVGATLVLNMLDAVMTVAWLQLGRATEANPLMDELLRMGPVPFVAVKIVLVSAGSYLLWRRRHHTLSVVSIVLVFLVYFYILLFHLNAMNLRLLSS